MATRPTLSPLFRHSIGFDRFNDLFETVLHDEESGSGYPPYDIIKLSKEGYRIRMAVAGFNRDELTVTEHDDKLIIASKAVEANDTGWEYLHRGIARRAFERVFRLADHMKVTAARMENGLLEIDLLRVVPTTVSPRTIRIGGDARETKPTVA